MKDKTLWLGWGLLAALCTGLGFIPSAQGFGKAILVLLALVFFLPGVVLLVRSVNRKDRKTALRIRRISLVSLGLTLLLLVLNLLSVNASQGLGNFLYTLLALVSVPMLCIRFWWLSLFLWGSLLTASLLYAPKKAC